MSELLVIVTSAASLGLSAASLLFTVAAYRKLDDNASEAFAAVGADEGNHEARLERLETKAGLQVIPSPSQVEVMTAEPGCIDEGYYEEFADAEEDVALVASDNAIEEEFSGY